MDKLTRWEYFTSALALLLHLIWANYDYANDPNKIPYEPIISAIITLCGIWGYVFYQKNKTENPITIEEQVVHFGASVKNSENTVVDSTITARDVKIGSDTIAQQTIIERQYVTYEGDRQIPVFLQANLLKRTFSLAEMPT
jgi:hypothetical protein